MSRQEDIKELIGRLTRRLQKLNEQRAVQGISVDPQILIQMEDIEAEIEKLQAELKGIEDGAGSTPQTNSATSSNIHEKTQGSLIIMSGRYWAEDHWDDAWKDATPVLSSMISDGELELTGNYDVLFGDPKRKARKKLTITYFYSGQEICITVPQNTGLILPLVLYRR